MKLPFQPPLAPMLSKRASELPSGPGWIFEPKWDGFRTIAFRDGEEVVLMSRDDKPLQRYFPDVVEALRAALPERCVLDGEIVVAVGDKLEFEVLQQRLHPAASRVNLLAKETPASVVFWDVLAIGDEDLRNVPFRQRRARLEALLAGAKPPVHLTPATEDRAVATDWFNRFEGAGLDGVMAKREEGVYEPNKRVMIKVKHERTCDCVVAGFRWHKNGRGTHVGSLILALYDDAGVLHSIGVTASFTEAKRKELVTFLEPYRENALDSHPWKDWAGDEAEWARRPDAKSRWSRGKSMSWEPLRLELVVEVAYDHMQGARFRHTAQFRRWRSDKRPTDCRYDQLDVTPPFELAKIFGEAAAPGS